MSAVKNVFKLIEENNIQFVDFRFIDIKGRWHSITVNKNLLENETFEDGLNFDGSSVEGWCEIHKSDMFYKPDAETAFIDPFLANPTLVLLCDIIDADSGEVYNRCPRGIADRAEKFLASSGIADKALMGPELEFFLFDNVAYSTEPNENFYSIDAPHGKWSSGDTLEEGNTGHIANYKGGYFQVPPVDRLHDIRSEMLKTLENLGIETLIHHAEVATAGQCEMGMAANSPKLMADQVQMYKYVVKNVADLYGKTATFMPKPIHGDNGSGMHVHQSLVKGKENIFAGNEYNGLSQEALHYIGGIIKHSRAINAFANPTTNSYKRLIPGYEAPVILTYAGRNRSAAIRIPASKGDKAKRIEVRYPDPSSNAYLAFAAMLMAGLDGIKNKITPGKAMEENLYDLPREEVQKIPHVCSNLRVALEELDKDRDFLREGNVFDDDFIDAYIELRMEDVEAFEHAPTPGEFDRYYSV